MTTITVSQPSISPFTIRAEDATATCASRGFHILRSYLAANENNLFCNEHDVESAEVREECLLHRDIIHALVVPVVQMCNRAAELARAALCSDKPEELELAFRDDARGAFVGLQCFLTDEEDFCHTRGCPACVANEVLASESHLRFIIAAILLSEDTATPAESPSSLTLPPLSFFLSSVRAAILNDTMWGVGFSEHVYERAEKLANGMRQLIKQCGELQTLVESPRLSPMRSPTSPNLSNVLQSDDSIKMRPSKLAKRQARLQQEEQAYIRRLAHQCWGAVALPKHVRESIKSSTMANRPRSSSCPGRPGTHVH